MSARSLFRADLHMALVAIRSQWPSVALQARSWMVMEKPKLPGNGRFRSNNRDRRFESILLHHSVHRGLPLFGESLFRSVFSVPPGMERLRASTSLATVEKIGPSSEA